MLWCAAESEALISTQFIFSCCEHAVNWDRQILWLFFLNKCQFLIGKLLHTLCLCIHSLYTSGLWNRLEMAQSLPHSRCHPGLVWCVLKEYMLVVWCSTGEMKHCWSGKAEMLCTAGEQPSESVDAILGEADATVFTACYKTVLTA